MKTIYEISSEYNHAIEDYEVYIRKSESIIDRVDSYQVNFGKFYTRVKKENINNIIHKSLSWNSVLYTSEKRYIENQEELIKQVYEHSKNRK